MGRWDSSNPLPIFMWATPSCGDHKKQVPRCGRDDNAVLDFLGMVAGSRQRGPRRGLRARILVGGNFAILRGQSRK
jgi:hypothetical protein